MSATKEIAAAAAGTNVHFLDNESVVNGVPIVSNPRDYPAFACDSNVENFFLRLSKTIHDGRFTVSCYLHKIDKYQTTATLAGQVSCRLIPHVVRWIN